MRLKKYFTYKDSSQIWRLLISSDDKLVIETRDTDKKEVTFNCIDLSTGKSIFNDLQLEEKFWIGIETIYQDKIYFHLYAKPNMPEHKKIIAFDLGTQQVIWKNEDLVFLSINDGKLFAFKKKFEGQDVFLLDAQTGDIIEELGNDPNRFNAILNEAQFNEDYSNYKYPEAISDLERNMYSEVIEKEFKNKEVHENINSLRIDDFLCMNYYRRSKNNLLDNEFVVYNIEKKKKVISETINKNLNSYSPDSFFCYKNYLLVLKNKDEILSYKLT